MPNDPSNTRSRALTDLEKEQLHFAAERITQHENKSYENFGLFLKLSTVLVGGLGYLAVHRNDRDYWVVQSIAWSMWRLELFIAFFFSLMIFLEYLGIRRQWNKQSEMGVKRGKVSWSEMFKHVQPYFVLGMLILLVGLRELLVEPLFK